MDEYKVNQIETNLLDVNTPDTEHFTPILSLKSTVVRAKLGYLRARYTSHFLHTVLLPDT